MKYQTTVGSKTFDVEITRDGDVLVNGVKRDIDFLSLGENLYSMVMDSASHEVVVEEQPDHEYEVLIHGRLYGVRVLDERALLLGGRRGAEFSETGEVSVRAPMPGLIVALQVAEGDAVSKGQTLVILESMKMQNELKSPRDGIVQRIGVAAGESVEQNKLLVTLH